MRVCLSLQILYSFIHSFLNHLPFIEYAWGLMLALYIHLYLSFPKCKVDVIIIISFL